MLFQRSTWKEFKLFAMKFCWKFHVQMSSKSDNLSRRLHQVVASFYSKVNEAWNDKAKAKEGNKNVATSQPSTPNFFFLSFTFIYSTQLVRKCVAFHFHNHPNKSHRLLILGYPRNMTCMNPSKCVEGIVTIWCVYWYLM